MRPSYRAAALVPILQLVPALALAAWSPGGDAIGSGTGFAAAAGADRVVVAWVRSVGSGPGEVRARAWTADGDPAPGWPVDGVLVGAAAGYVGAVTVAEDGAGGAFVAWVSNEGTQGSARLQHVSGTGSIFPGWPAEGIPMGTATYVVPTLASDGAGGVLAGRVEYNSAYETQAIVQRLDGSGATVSGWPVGGLPIANSYDVAMLADKQGHLFVSAAEFDPSTRRPVGMRVRRLDGSGAPDPAWPQAGALLTQALGTAGLRLFADGAGGVFPSWYVAIVCVDFCPEYPARWASRILGDGSPHGGWIPGRAAYSLAPDGSGGMFLALNSGARPSVVRLDAGGSAMPGWSADGNAAMTEVVSSTDLRVTGDGRGGAFVTWQDFRTGEYRLYSSRLDASGRIAAGWPATGSKISTRAYPRLVDLLTLKEDVAVAVWEEYTPSGTTAYISALAPGEPGPIAELGPVPSAVGFGVVELRPNPARGPIVAVVELPDGQPARLELVDAAGRMLESQSFNFWGQARGAVRFNAAGGLPSGVYWIRLTQGHRLATRKVVVLR
jgi:hypothetical protein